MAAIVWFTRDLRLTDHPALWAALDSHREVIPVFCLDDRLLIGRHASGPRVQFLLESLTALDRALVDRGGRLVVRRDAPERALPQIALASGAREVHASGDLGPFARARLGRVRVAMTGVGGELVEHPGIFAADDPDAISGAAGRPYTVFSPFARAWSSAPRREPLPAPGAVVLPAGIDCGRIPTLGELGLRQELVAPASGGEPAARARFAEFIDHGLERYAEQRQVIAAGATSRLSPYLHLGCISAREIESRLGKGSGPAEFRRSLAWRDFYGQVLRHHPGNARHEFQERYRDTLDWEEDEQAAEAWRDGRTGFPLVDAGMRQLREEGWMHNRARLLAGSFLTKDLGLDWRLGERHFMRLLLDGDEASNNGNWQWIASVGVDPMPVWRRLYNPTLHAKRYDPSGSYVRRYVPELRAVGDEHLAEPWRMPIETQRSVGCLIGTDYPAPIVDHRTARAAALERFRTAAQAEPPEASSAYARRSSGATTGR
ncbi:MAG: deoxyribodipyrimidine photo-lyase [Thermoleophilaceae bacterium]